MKASLVAITLILPVGLALAQKEPGNQSNNSGSNTAVTPGSPSSSRSTTNPSEVKTKTYKGTLVDAACASGAGPSTSAEPSQTQSAARSSSTSESSQTKAGQTGEANRVAGSGQSCDATTSTTDFGLRMRDGQVLRFDTVGSERAKQAISSRKKWSDNAAAGKPIRASVTGMENGDRLTVVQIN